MLPESRRRSVMSINYTDENGNIITDGYGYIDPYTGSYIN